MVTIGKYFAGMLSCNFRFRYAWLERFGEYNHIHLFIIGERNDKPMVPFLEEIVRGQRYAAIRFWYVDIELPEQQRILKQIPYEYPLPLSPATIAYDGNRYLYFIYNKYNIWRLDFKAVLSDPNGTHWMRLPPCMNCNFLGDTRTPDYWRTYFIEPNYLLLLSTDGRMARMDTETFAWFYDKDTPPLLPFITPKLESQNNNISKLYKKIGLLYDSGLDVYDNIMQSNFGNDISQSLSNLKLPPDLLSSISEIVNKQFNDTPSKIANGLDNDEVYLVNFGGIGGKVMNVYDKQWDNFFFDTRVCRDTLKVTAPVFSQDLWPMYIKRRRLYVTNVQGHLFYAWLRIDGLFDVEYQMNDFYQVDEVRVYADYTVLNQWQQVEVQVYAISSGWVTVPQDKMQPIINENDWLWDSEYTRQYVRIIPTSEGLPRFQYTKVPPNYISVDVSYLQQPISKIRVKYKPLESEVNYIARINKVEAISGQTILASYDSADSNTPLEIIKLEPIQKDQDYSIEFAVYVKNTGDYPVKDVIAYVVDNQWLQMTLDDTDENSWVRYNQDNPLQLGDIDAGAVKKFYIRGMNIDERPHMQDLVIVGVYPYKTS